MPLTSSVPADSPSGSATYNDTIVRQFALAAVIWGVVSMLVGVFIAAQMAWPALNFDVPWLSFGRLRPLHTNAAIFAFGGCALFATSYWVVQRTCQVRIISDKLAALHFWLWQAVIVAAAITLPLGITRGKEYAELEWPISIAIAVAWVAYAIVFFGTVGIRKVRHIYVANWFYGAFIIAVALLHITNAMSMPASSLLSTRSGSGESRRPSTSHWSRCTARERCSRPKMAGLPSSVQDSNRPSRSNSMGRKGLNSTRPALAM